jgi:hypothetical protein
MVGRSLRGFMVAIHLWPGFQEPPLPEIYTAVVGVGQRYQLAVLPVQTVLFSLNGDI